ncbi:hypothetical protein NMG60_11034710 [Bertholletia excelsa]
MATPSGYSREYGSIQDESSSTKKEYPNKFTIHLKSFLPLRITFQQTPPPPPPNTHLVFYCLSPIGWLILLC